jgi:hypothetical protein
MMSNWPSYPYIYVRMYIHTLVMACMYSDRCTCYNCTRISARRISPSSQTNVPTRLQGGQDSQSPAQPQATPPLLTLAAAPSPTPPAPLTGEAEVHPTATVATPPLPPPPPAQPMPPPPTSAAPVLAAACAATVLEPPMARAPSRGKRDRSSAATPDAQQPVATKARGARVRHSTLYLRCHNAQDIHCQPGHTCLRIDDEVLFNIDHAYQYCSMTTQFTHATKHRYVQRIFRIFSQMSWMEPQQLPRYASWRGDESQA